jgi:predicted ArsR family transcriptional regulator
MTQQILRYIQKRPVRGYTTDEMAAKTGWDAHGVAGRFQDLKRSGHIAPNGTTRRSRAGRPVMVWSAK